MKPENLKCPDCNGPMVSRLNKVKQTRFWGCKSFPNCKGTRDVDGLSKKDREILRDKESDFDYNEGFD